MIRLPEGNHGIQKEIEKSRKEPDTAKAKRSLQVKMVCIKLA
jgi:hypothetical protein